MFGFQLGQFVSVYGNCFQLVCVRTCSDTIFAWRSLRFTTLEIIKKMEWIPAVLVTFKVLVLGTGMFYAIKWHYDQGEKEKEQANERRAVMRASGKVAAGFVLSLMGLGLATVALCRMLGLDLTFL